MLLFGGEADTPDQDAEVLNELSLAMLDSGAWAALPMSGGCL